MAANVSTQFSTSEVEKLQAQLKEIDELRVDGKFVSVTGEVPVGNEETCELLDKCLLWSGIVLQRYVFLMDTCSIQLILIPHRKGKMPENFSTQYQTLIDIRNKLEKLSLTQAWSLRETDLYDYQRQLDKIDESRVDGNFVDADGVFAELYVQRVSFDAIH